MKLFRSLSLGLVLPLALLPCLSAQQTPAAMPMEHKPSTPSTSVTLTGNGKTLTFSTAELRAMPQHSVTVRNGHSKMEETYTGVPVADLLAKLGMTTEPAGRKQVLHSTVRAEGTDHYFVLFSAAELEPGLREGDAIVALTVGGKPLEADGQLKLVCAGEKEPARWVRNLDALTVTTARYAEPRYCSRR